MTTVRAAAHPNIALVKYWGKQPGSDNRPAVPSLSITLDTLTAETEASVAGTDEFSLDGQLLSGNKSDQKLTRFLDFLRRHHDVPPLHINSKNNFPTAAGLASSAAGFAALVTAVNSLCDLNLSITEQSQLARVGSASAARSLLGGYVGLKEPNFAAEQIALRDHWPLAVVVAITDTGRKAISSTDGMKISATTSPYYAQWLETAAADYAQAERAVAERNFAALATVSEHSCLKMHAVMQTSQPALLYWNAATIACMHGISQLRADGLDVFFTMDAGPQVKAVCTAESAATVAAALAEVPGVARVEQVALGGPARLLQ